MANANPSSAKTQYKVVYTIRDGDNEYECSTWQPLDHDPTELECAKAVIANFSQDKQTEKECLAEFKAHRYFTIPHDYRIVSEFGAVPDLDRCLAEAAADMLNKLTEMVEVARCVAANWESGDLARAVKSLSRVADEAEAVVTNAKGL
jgi:hypothetical protein